jgi:hypothetical protein
MSHSTSQHRSWFYQFIRAIAVVELVYFAAALVDLALHPNAPTLAGDSATLRILDAVVEAPVIIGVGVLVVYRTRGNLIGWMLVLWGAIIGASSVRVDAFGGYAAEFSFFSSSLWPVLWAIPLHFPDGLPYPRRLGRVAQGIIAATIALLFLASLGSPTIDSSVPMRAGTHNQFYLPILPLPSEPGLFIFAPVLIIMVLLIVSVTMRFRASRGRERQQLKYMLGGAVFLVAITVLGISLGTTSTASRTYSDWRAVVAYALYFAPALVPVVGVALPILRHQLYDIDIIIRRTVTYTILTVLLLAVYFGGVVLLQQTFVALTGQQSELAIILSTLAIAALFVPLRNGIQRVIDRRFYRKKYDAARVLELFAVTARDEVDATKLVTRLIDVVDETLQPEHISLWLSHTVGQSGEVNE